MIYSIFIKKNQNDKAKYVHVSLLRQIILQTKNVFILGWPGYIGTTKKRIDDFYNEINPFAGKQLNGFFFKPLQILTIPVFGTNEQYMNRVFGGHALPQSNLNDHSKILAILSVNQKAKSKNGSSNTNIVIKNIAYTVKALLIGSSNQSYETYCRNKALKGEADILMIDIDETTCKTNSDDDSAPLRETIGNKMFELIANNDNVVISKEISASNKSLDKIVKKLLGY